MGLAAASYALFRGAGIPSAGVNAAAGLLLAAATLLTAHTAAWHVFASDLHARVQGGSLDEYLARHGKEAWRELAPGELAGEYLGYVLDLGRPGGYFSYLRLRAADGYEVLDATRFTTARTRHRQGFRVWVDLAVDTLVVAWGLLVGVTWACWTGLPQWVPFRPREPEPETVATAARRRDWAQLGDLLSRGGDPNLRDGSQGPTALHYAARAGRTREMERLLRAGAWPNTPDRDGRTALHWAAEVGEGTAVELLLAQGFAWCARDRAGRTPLHDAAEGGHAAAARRLLEAGADPGARDSSGASPLVRARDNGNTAVVALLEASGADRARPGLRPGLDEPPAYPPRT